LKSALFRLIEIKERPLSHFVIFCITQADAIDVKAIGQVLFLRVAVMALVA
jgi:hypothetical protein